MEQEKPQHEVNIEFRNFLEKRIADGDLTGRQMEVLLKWIDDNAQYTYEEYLQQTREKRKEFREDFKQRFREGSLPAHHWPLALRWMYEDSRRLGEDSLS